MPIPYFIGLIAFVIAAAALTVWIVAGLAGPGGLAPILAITVLIGVGLRLALAARR